MSMAGICSPNHPSSTARNTASTTPGYRSLRLANMAAEDGVHPEAARITKIGRQLVVTLQNIFFVNRVVSFGHCPWVVLPTAFRYAASVYTDLYAPAGSAWGQQFVVERVARQQLGHLPCIHFLGSQFDRTSRCLGLVSNRTFAGRRFLLWCRSAGLRRRITMLRHRQRTVSLLSMYAVSTMKCTRRHAQASTAFDHSHQMPAPAVRF